MENTSRKRMFSKFLEKFCQCNTRLSFLHLLNDIETDSAKNNKTHFSMSYAQSLLKHRFLTIRARAGCNYNIHIIMWERRAEDILNSASSVAFGNRRSYSEFFFGFRPPSSELQFLNQRQVRTVNAYI